MQKLFGIKRLKELARLRTSLNNPFDRLLAQMDDVPNNITLDAAFEFFIKSKLAPNNCSSMTISDYRYVQRIWREMYPGIMANQLTPAHAVSMMSVFYEGSTVGRNNRLIVDENGNTSKIPVSPQRVAGCHIKFMAVMRYLVGLAMCNPGVLDALERMPLPTKILQHVRPPNRHKRIVSEDELTEVKHHIANEASRDMLSIMFYAGARPQDVFRMHKDHLTRVASDFWYYDPPTHKTSYIGNQRIIPFGPVCIEILERHLSKVRYEDGPIFRNAIGEKWTLTACRTHMERGIKYGNIKPVFTMRDLRRSYVNRINVLHGREIAALMAGHTGSICKTHYLRENLAKMELIAKEIS